jgi:hypothetical protein
MKFRQSILLKTLLISCVALMVFGQVSSNCTGAQSKEKTIGMYVPDALTLLDEKASHTIGTDEAAVRDLAAAVVDWAVSGQLPELFSRPYKERLLRAEMSFRRGDSPGASESSIVRLIDGLAQKLDAPEYARSDEDEVHRLRLLLSYETPHMVVATPGVNDPNDPTSRTLPETLSPVEAVFVTRQLLIQKEISEAFQTTSLERSQVRKNVESLDPGQFPLSNIERITIYNLLLMEVADPNSARHTAQDFARAILQARAVREQNSTRAVTSHVLTQRVQSERTEQINKVFRRAYSMKISEALALTDSSLELIGIPAPSKKD